jgi:hypothetical protein
MVIYFKGEQYEENLYDSVYYVLTLSTCLG